MKVKYLILSACAIAFFLGSLVGCGPSKAEREEAARQDSIRIADSIAQAEEEARLAAIEAARQDSLAKIEKFKKSLPDFKAFYVSMAMIGNENSNEIDLEKLGFTKKQKRVYTGYEDFENWGMETTYLLEVDKEHYCKIVERPGYECITYTLSIVGYPDIFEKYKEDATKFKSSPDFQKYGFGPWMKIEKDKIVWGDGL